MAQADNVVVTRRFRLDGDDAGLVMASMREARLRTGKTRGEFAQAINGRAGRPLQLGPGSIEAYETGYAQPVADVFVAALELAGLDVRSFLSRWLYA